MPTSLLRLTLNFFFPAGFLTAATIILLHFVDLPQAVRAFFPFFPSLVVGVGLFLGWRFNRTRLIFALIVLAVVDQVLLFDMEPPQLLFARAALATLLPLNLVFFSSITERGLLTAAGISRLLLLLTQPFLLLWLHQNHYDAVMRLLTWTLYDHHLLSRLQIPQPALAVYAFALVVTSIRFLRRPAPLDAAFPWAIAITGGALATGMSGEMLTLYFSAAAFVLATAVLETSHGMAYRDELTSLPARRALNEALLKTGRRYTVAMVDIDHFKKINDTHGHDVGDEVLKMVAAKLAGVRGGGRAFRYGGEEFTILFPGRGAQETTEHLEDLREIIAKANFTIRNRKRPKRKPKNVMAVSKGTKVPVTVSIGVAEHKGSEEAATVIKAADKALYRAKSGGRNRVCS